MHMSVCVYRMTWSPYVIDSNDEDGKGLQNTGF